MCQRLQPAVLSEEWLGYFGSVRGTIGGEVAKVLSSMIDAPTQLALRTAANQTYQVVVLRFTPKGHQFWKAPRQVRIVVTHDWQVERAVVEGLDG